MKTFVRLSALVLLGYLLLSLLADWYVERNFRWDLFRHLNMMGKTSFMETDKLERDMKGDPALQAYLRFLNFTPPVGWAFRHRLEHLEDAVIFASKNLALPEAQRFADPALSRQYGFDPGDRADRGVAHALFTQVW
jgi:hypothetical protein